MARSDRKISSPKEFRRKIHRLRDLRSGVDNSRQAIEIAAIPGIVEELMAASVYRAAVTPNPFPDVLSRFKKNSALRYTSQEAEFVWSAAVLKHYSSQLNDFAQIKREFDHTYLSANYEEARFWLDEVQHRFGYSLWLIDNRFQVLQKESGLSAQKEYLTSVLSEEGLSRVAAHLCLQCSFASEDNISLTDLNRFQLQSNRGLLPHISDYLVYQINPFSVSNIDSPSYILCIEESSPIIDRFNTFIEMAQLELTRAMYIVPDHLRIALELVRSIDDERLTSLFAVIDGRISADANTTAKFLAPYDAYTVGDYALAKDLLVKDIARDAGRIESYELLARCLAQLNDAGETLPTNTAFRVVQLQNAVLELRGDIDSSRYELERIAIQSRRQRCSRLIPAFLSRAYNFATAQEFTEMDALLVLGGFPANPWHQPILSGLSDGDSIFADLLAKAPHSTSLLLFQAVNEPAGIAGPLIEGLKLPAARTSLYLGHAASKSGDLSAAISSYREVLASVNNFSALSAMRPLYDALSKLGQHKDLLELIVESYFMNRGSYTLFPLEQLILARKLPTNAEDALLHAIVVEIATRHLSSSFEPDLSDAYELYMDFSGYRRPSEIKIAADLWPQRIEHFLSYVCRVRTMEDSTEFENYDDVERERILILQNLNESSSEKTAQNLVEIQDITKELEVAALFQRFEAGRLYVDETGIVRTVASQFRDSFARLKQLLLEPELEYQSAGIAKLVKAIFEREEEDETIKTMTVTVTQRDGLLNNIVDSFIDQFVLNPDYGFKSYLSTSILHGHLEGELRSAARKNGLLFVAEDSAAKVQIAGFWEKKLPSLAPSEWHVIHEALAHFSNRLNRSIAHLKDEKLRIKMDNTQEGLFIFAPNWSDLDGIRREIGPDTKLGTFFDILFRFGWSKVDASLPSVEKEIRSIGHLAENACNQLQKTLEDNGLRLKAAQIFDAIAHTRTQLAIDLDRILGWFRRTTDRSEETFSIDATVQVAIKVVNNCNPHRPISPTILIDTPAPCSLRGTALDPTIHVLVNCLQNAVSYSGFECAPDIVLKVAGNGDDMLFEVQNTLAPGVDLESLRTVIQAKLDEVRLPNTSEIVHSNHGTGLHKIRRSLAKDIGCDPSISCVVSDDRTFTISIGVRQKDIVAC